MTNELSVVGYCIVNQMSNVENYTWHPQPEAALVIHNLLDDIVSRSVAAQEMSSRLRDETGTRLFDWIDHLVLPIGKLKSEVMYAHGFKLNHDGESQIWSHPSAMLPPLVQRKEESDVTVLTIKVESVEEFLAKQDLQRDSVIIGEPHSSYRAVQFAQDPDIELWANERHGYRGFTPQVVKPELLSALQKHEERFLSRTRHFKDEDDGFQHAGELISAAASDLGVNRACDLFFAKEREYWQERNLAARVQKARQDRLGLGWANHDHHTYRSSREHFHRLVAVLEQLGFNCREQFYAGHESGWGAQVLEQTSCGITVFADVDLAAGEVHAAFAHHPLSPCDELGTVGLWCKLHGEAFLGAGMHHLECQFDFDAIRVQLATADIGTMAPFTDFPYLRQAFTVGQMWVVEPERISALVMNGWIDQQQANRFKEQGAIGSHLEILERNEGYKGFNQTGISEIIQRTDPRHASNPG